ncbi:MAG: 50S ribosomal protein L18 [Clostridia bacterium]|nr:50S ribosomal protein L18 [Clostridia bacterium]
MIKKESRKEVHRRKHLRVRKKIAGSAERPRLTVYRSLKHMYAQIVDDTNGRTLVSASTLDPELRQKLTNRGNREAARQVGLALAAKALERGISRVVFDRSGYIYHGRVQALAEGAREGGLEF